MALLLVALIIPLVAIDQYLGRPSALNPRLAVAAENGVEFDPRWAPDVALDERAAGNPPTYPSITPANFHTQLLAVPDGPVMPFGQVANARIALCNEDGRYRLTQSDRHGFINPDAHWQRSRFTAVLVGDSFAEGWCVDQHESFASLLNLHLDGVLNLGRGSMGAIAEMAALREYATDVTADFLVWTVFEGNDWEDLATESTNPTLSRYLADPSFSQNLKARQSQIQTALHQYADHYLDSYAWKRHIPFGRWRAVLGEAQMLNWISGVTQRFDSRSPAPGSEQGHAPAKTARTDIDKQGLADQAFAAGFAQARFMGARPVVVLLPSFDSYPEPTPTQTERRANLRRMTEAAGGLFVDGDLAFRQSVNDPRTLYPLRIWGHYTAQGHAVIAQAILAATKGATP